MKRTYKIIAALVGIAALLAGATIAEANPSYFANGVATSVATSSPAYMTPGAATSTTPTYDSYVPTTKSQTFKADRLGLLQQFCASSTATVLNTSVEYSQDGIDWYQNFIVDSIQAGTTTTPYVLVTPFSATQKFASSSLNGAPVAANNNCRNNALIIPTSFRYVRVVQSVTGGNGSIWDQLVPTKELY
jgi:hypothetical protein